MDRYVDKNKKIMISDMIYIHPEECGNDKLNKATRNNIEDIKVLDLAIKDLGDKTANLIKRTSSRLDTVMDTITAEKERLQDIIMLCNSNTDFDNSIPLTDYHFTGNFTYEDNVFSSAISGSSTIKARVEEVIGNGYEGNKHVKKDNGYLTDTLSTKNRSAITDNTISTYWEYSRITASSTEPYLITDFNTDAAEAKCTLSMKFERKANQLAIKSTTDTIKVTAIRYSQDNVLYTDVAMMPFTINKKEDSYLNQDYIYGSNLIAFPSCLYLKVTFESVGYINNDIIAFERTIPNTNDKLDTITTIVSTAKRHVIKLNNVEVKSKQYLSESIMKSKELITSGTDIYAISIFANIYLPAEVTKDSIKFTLTINGEDYKIKPVNSHEDGIKVIRFSQGKMPTKYTKYIGEKISSAYLTIAINTKTNITPYINNLKVLLGEEV